MAGSSPGSAAAAQTGSAVPATSHTSPGANTPAPRVAAISSPQPTTTTVSGDRPVRSAKAGVTGPTAWVPGASWGSMAWSMPTASTTGSDQVRVRGSSRARDEALDQSTASTPAASRSTYDPGGIRWAARANTSGSWSRTHRALKTACELSRLAPVWW
jgi:hypothetical protein